VPKEVYNFKGKEVQKVQKKTVNDNKKVTKTVTNFSQLLLETVHWNKPFSVEYGV